MSSSQLVPRLFTTARWLYGVRSVSVSPVLRFYSNSTEGPIFVERLGGEYKGDCLQFTVKRTGNLARFDWL